MDLSTLQLPDECEAAELGFGWRGDSDCDKTDTHGMTEAGPRGMDYRVDLPDFQGPLDLLLYLVKKNEVDILDIPIAKVATQFQEYLAVLHVADVEIAGDFLVMASTLMEIKSRMLLPQSAPTT